MKSFIVWEGPSELDGKLIVLIATSGGSIKNRKTGGMVQTYILRSDMPPNEALRAGEDASICGDCKHRSGSCYVRVEQGPLVVWKAYKRGSYPKATLEQSAQALSGLKVRLGTYGDPAALPPDLIPALLANAKAWTGYTHQWHRPMARHLARYCMASCDTLAEHAHATAQGWRCFTVVPKDYKGHIPGKSFLCPASKEAGEKIQCHDCTACDGTSSGRTASVYIPVHGVSHKQRQFELITIGHTTH